MSLEGDKAQDYEFNGIIPGDGGKGRKDVGANLISIGVLACQRVRDVGSVNSRHERRRNIAPQV